MRLSDINGSCVHNYPEYLFTATMNGNADSFGHFGFLPVKSIKNFNSKSLYNIQFSKIIYCVL